ncbi:MAG TPA: hypothetical protein VJ652_15100 [Noviherbaspirillum sp.]|nr:hypothetical protein [Noviherbaspirillum sp.]
MATLKLIQFSGEIPRLIPRLLPDTAAQRAENVRLDDGGLTPIRIPGIEHTLTGFTAGQVKTIYKHAGEWLAWTVPVKAAPGPVAADRLYYTGDGKPKMRVSGSVYDLAVNGPTAAPTVTLTGTGSGDIYSALYVYTFLTAFDEESEPSPVSNTVNWQAGKTVTLSGFSAPDPGRNITKMRLYRLQQSVQSGADLYFIAERTVSTADWIDNVAIDAFAEVLPSRDWNPPPDGLSGLISLPNGMMAGFVGKDLYFCEPFHPHAWPEKYVLTMDYTIVGLGAFGNTIVVATTGNPYIVTGSAPENMQQEKLELNLPCINPNGVVDLGYTVAYPSNDGLVTVDSSGPKLYNDLFTRPGWQKTNPSSYIAGQFSGRYFASFSYIEADGKTTEGTFIIDLSGEQPFLLRAKDRADAFFYEQGTGSLYLLLGLDIYEWDRLGQTNAIMTWKSKLFVLPQPSSFGAILVEGDDALSVEERAAKQAERQAILDANALIFGNASLGGEFNGAAMNAYAIEGDDLARIDPDGFVSVKIYADTELIATIGKINEVMRIPAARARNWEVQVNGTRPVTQISLATTARELNSI